MTGEDDVELENDGEIGGGDGDLKGGPNALNGKDPEPSGDKKPSLRDAIKASVEKLRQPGDDDKPDATKPKAKPEKPDRVTPEKPDRVAAKPKVPPGTAAGTAPAEAPKGWTDEAKTAWNALPDAVKAAVAKREADIAEGVKKIQERYKPIHDTVTKAAPMMEKYQQTPAAFVDRIVDWAMAIDRNPAAAIQALCQQYKVDPSKLTAPPATPPAANGTTQPNATINDPRIDGLVSKVQSFEAAEKTRQVSATNEALKAWSSGKPHFAAVRATMAQIVAGAMQMKDESIFGADGRIDLDKVYDQAIYMVPEVRDAILKEQRKAHTEAARDAASKARRAGNSVKPSAPASNRAGGKPTLRETIKAAFEEVSSR